MYMYMIVLIGISSIFLSIHSCVYNDSSLIYFHPYTHAYSTDNQLSPDRLANDEKMTRILGDRELSESEVHCNKICIIFLLIMMVHNLNGK